MNAQPFLVFWTFCAVDCYSVWTPVCLIIEEFALHSQQSFITNGKHSFGEQTFRVSPSLSFKSESDNSWTHTHTHTRAQRQTDTHTHTDVHTRTHTNTNSWRLFDLTLMFCLAWFYTKVRRNQKKKWYQAKQWTDIKNTRGNDCCSNVWVHMLGWTE